MRDEFLPEVKNVLARRVGMQCSNPNCRRPTSGPQEDPQKAINVGVAAHITAAAAGGPRFDKDLAPSERSCIENGIWLCQKCSKLVDNDPLRFSVDALREWKRSSESSALYAIECGLVKPSDAPGDGDLIRFYAQCLDRPAFQDPFMREGSMEAFDRAIEDTITALNTGCLRDRRDGAVLYQSKGKSFLHDREWRRAMETIVDLLRAIRSRYADACKQGVIEVTNGVDGHTYHHVRDPELAYWMDQTRSQILRVFSRVAHEAHVVPPFGRRMND
jgi:hypothetical protein